MFLAGGGGGPGGGAGAAHPFHQHINHFQVGPQPLYAAAGSCSPAWAPAAVVWSPAIAAVGNRSSTCRMLLGRPTLPARVNGATCSRPRTLGCVRLFGAHGAQLPRHIRAVALLDAGAVPDRRLRGRCDHSLPHPRTRRRGHDGPVQNPRYACFTCAPRRRAGRGPTELTCLSSAECCANVGDCTAACGKYVEVDAVAVHGGA